MRLSPLPFAIALAVMVPSRSHAEVPAPIRQANRQAAISAVARHFAYGEANEGTVAGAPDPLDAEDGWMPGARLDVRAQGDVVGIPDLYVAAFFTHVQSDLRYVGAIEHIDGGNVTFTPIQLTSGARIDEGGLALGIGVGLGESASITPLVRWEYRYWLRSVGKDTARPYDEAYTHHEIAAGALGQLAVSERVVLGAELTIGTTIAANMDNKLFAPTVFALPLGSRPVFAGTLSADFAVAPYFHLGVAYGARAFAYGKSDPVRLPPPNEKLGLTEPASTTTEHELRGAAAFAF